MRFSLPAVSISQREKIREKICSTYASDAGADNKSKASERIAIFFVLVFVHENNTVFYISIVSGLIKGYAEEQTLQL